MLAFSGDNFGSGLPGSLGLSGHGPLELLRQPDIFHFHTLHLDTPWVSGLVEGGLHHVGNDLPVRQNVAQVLGAQNVTEGGGGQQAGGLAVIVHVGNGTDGIIDFVIHDGVNVHGDRVFGQNLFKVDIETKSTHFRSYKQNRVVR